MSIKKFVVKGLVLLAGVCLMSVLTTSTAQAVNTYFVSSSIGDDNNDGNTESTPWKTMNKVNEQTFAPGDTIKFKRGDEWATWPWADGVLTPPSSGTASQRITFTNYGTGNLPLFRASRQLVSNYYQWTQSSSGTNEYYCEAAGGGSPWLLEVKVVEADDELLIGQQGHRDLDPPDSVIGELEDHRWGWGDNDSLGFNTVYIRDDSGVPGSPGGFQSLLASQSSCIEIDGKSYINIDGIDIRNGESGISINNSSYLILQNVICKMNSSGIRILRDSAYNQVLDSDLSYNYRDGIDAWADTVVGGNNVVSRCTVSHSLLRHGIMSTNVGLGFSEVSHNVVEYNKEFGIWIAQESSGCIVEYNICNFNSQGESRPEIGNWHAIEIKHNASIVRYNICANSHRTDGCYDGGGIAVGSAPGTEVYYNIIYGNDGPGIKIGSGNILVYNNTLYNNSKNVGSVTVTGGLRVGPQSGPNVVVKNNIIAFDSHYSLWVSMISNVTLDNNCFYRPSGNMIYWGGTTYTMEEFSNYQNDTGQDANSIAEDPNFKNAPNEDFHLSFNSPCKDAGTDVGLTEDYEGNPVPYGADPDIGAYEYQGEMDSDNDGILDADDNCPETPNGPLLGTCTGGAVGQTCTSDSECGNDGFCSMAQEDADGDGIGDACDVLEKQWVKSYGWSNADRAYSILQTADGGYIVAGNTKSFGAGGWDIWVLKLDSNGSVTWQKTYGGSNDDYADYTHFIQQTTDEGYIVASHTKSFGAGGWDIWVLKLDSNGNVTWQKSYGGSNDDQAYFIQQTAEGGYIVAGATQSFGAGGWDIWVLNRGRCYPILWCRWLGYLGA